MVKRWIISGILAIILMAVFFLPFDVKASPLARVIIGGSFNLGQDEILNEDLTILGGNAVLEQDSIVKGNIQLLGGSLDVDGEVKGDVLAAGGLLKLGPTAHVDGDVTIAGALLERDDRAYIGGHLTTESDIPFNFTEFNGMWNPFQWWLNSLWNVVWYIGLAFGLSALAVLVMMFFEKQTELTSQVLIKQPTASTGLGCLTAVVVPFAAIILTLTICLIPAVMVALLIIGVAITFGWIALGLEVGQRLSIQLHQDWAPPFAAGIGTFILVLVGGLLNIIPFIGWVFTALVSSAGIGAVLLTRFGTKNYEPGVKYNVLPEKSPADIPSSTEQFEAQSVDPKEE